MSQEHQATMSQDHQVGPLVSVVMSTFEEVNLPPPGGGAGSLLSNAIQSVIAQSYPNWELWVVSDHPPERFREAIEKLVASFQDQRIHHEDLASRGGAVAPGVKPKRRGVKNSQGELLAFLDADNAFEPDHLRRCVQAFQESEGRLDVAYCDTRVVYAERSGSHTERPGVEDLLQNAVALPYHFLGALYGEKFADELKTRLSPPAPIGPLAGASFIWEKPDWDATARKKLEHYNFIDMSDAVMTRAAFEAAGGFHDLIQLDWRLWNDMIQAGRDRFRHIRHIGSRYTTASLTQHRQCYALGFIEKLDLPFDIRKLPELNLEVKERYKAKHSSRGAQARNSAADRSPRILFMSEAAAISHVARPFLLAEHLHREGYDVCFARDPRYSKLVSENGFRVVDLDSLPSTVVLKRLERQEPIYDVDTLDRYVQADLRILRDFKPDVVVGDQRHSLTISSRLARVPYISIADAQWSPATEVEYELTDSPMAAILGMPLSNLIFQFVHPVTFALQTIPLNVVRMKYGLPGIGLDYKSCYTYGDHTVYPNDPALFPLKEPLPPNHSFIGPLLWSPAVEKPEWWDKLPEDRPIVYVSLGSTGQPLLLQGLFNVLAKLPVTVIAATAARSKIGAVPENVFVADFLPGTEAAERSRLIICNGGTMSGQQALSAGVPYLGLISNMDQMRFSSVVRKAGACELILEKDVSEKTLRPVLSRMLTQESYRTAAGKLAADVARMDSRKIFEEVVCSILRDQAGRNNIERTA
jgi:UDP:flavonoid glycosyltransferase YjiC (YdhE family)/glycosyltransferase involved in cell wall biosynthesis